MSLIMIIRVSIMTRMTQKIKITLIILDFKNSNVGKNLILIKFYVTSSSYISIRTVVE